MFKNALCLFQQGENLCGCMFVYGLSTTHTTSRDILLLIYVSMSLYMERIQTHPLHIQGLLVLLLWACCWSRSVSIHNKTNSYAHFIVGCHAAAPSVTSIQPWWVFWVHILIPSWCTHLKLLWFTELSSVSLSCRHHYAFCWIMQLNWTLSDKYLQWSLGDTCVEPVHHYCTMIATKTMQNIRIKNPLQICFMTYKNLLLEHKMFRYHVKNP